MKPQLAFGFTVACEFTVKLISSFDVVDGRTSAPLTSKCLLATCFFLSFSHFRIVFFLSPEGSCVFSFCRCHIRVIVMLWKWRGVAQLWSTNHIYKKKHNAWWTVDVPLKKKTSRMWPSFLSNVLLKCTGSFWGQNLMESEQNEPSSVRRTCAIATK